VEVLLVCHLLLAAAYHWLVGALVCAFFICSYVLCICHCM
jgi:hypothetical protein